MEYLKSFWSFISKLLTVSGKVTVEANKKTKKVKRVVKK